MRTPVIAANWKMNKTRGEAAAFAREFLARDIPAGVEAVICPPFTAIAAVVEELGRAGKPQVFLGAQDLYWEGKGAFTGEISPSMIREAGCSFVIVAHSERRRLFGETDETANRKASAASAAGLTPIFCVGETAEERDAGLTAQILERQVRAGLAGLSAETVSRMVVAYEPVWAIGTGRAASPADARDAAALIRRVVAGMYGEAASQAVRVQYGGSVDPGNIAGFMAEEGVDGALVGGASLDPVKFAQIVASGR
ncbi:MAG: triose-phosphate isomerase [Ignavibacteriales bacterium]